MPKGIYEHKKLGPRPGWVKSKISRANTGKKASLETRIRQSIARKGMKMPPRTLEHRMRLSLAQKDVPDKEKVGYSRAHKWLYQYYGKADRCENDDCDGVSTCFEWSLRHGYEYDRVRENFWRQCKKCHNKYDNIYESRSR